jgi:hypothetical protein
LAQLLINFRAVSHLQYGTGNFSDLPTDYHRLYAIFSVFSFAVHALGLALIYPLLGSIVLSQRLDLTNSRRPFRHSIPAIVLYTTLLVGTSWMAAAVIQPTSTG